MKKLVIIGSGPIVIGQACEFDYSGTQACKVLMKEGFEVILINSNPATIMTDPEIATRVYVEPLTVEFVEKILEKERPDGLIPTLGGQTALNLAIQLHESGCLERLGVSLLGANVAAIKAGEDRQAFRDLLDTIGAHYPKSFVVESFEAGDEVAKALGFPVILRPSFTLGGGGGGIAYSQEEFQRMLIQALKDSPSRQVLVEESILGWSEFELEVMRDKEGTFVVVCSIENIDPCGVHTGDSITVAPQQTLSDLEYQEMRDEARKVIEAVGVETGGANIQFAVDPVSRKRVVIEMNPRVSRSSALASKATGFPIAKIAALLAVGKTLKSVMNDITETTPSCFEPAIDYIVTKIPRFAFDKFQGSQDVLDTQMRSVGEVMGIGRTLQESLMKALSALERSDLLRPIALKEEMIAYPNSQRIFALFQAFRDRYKLEDVAALTRIHPYFLEAIESLVSVELEAKTSMTPSGADYKKLKRLGFSDLQLARLWEVSEKEVRDHRRAKGVRPSFFKVDTCAGEFASDTPYFYSTYWSDFAQAPLARLAGKDRIAVLGSGANRIGQGIEFDYSCVRGVKALRARGVEAVMINSNPETVSTDYDVSDYLFFEPLTVEHVLSVFEFVSPTGFIAQLGGQTPIGLSEDLVHEGYKLCGSSLESIQMSEDREKFMRVCEHMGFRFPKAGMATSIDEAIEVAKRVEYPLIVRPSFVLGGSRMEVIESESDLHMYFDKFKPDPTHPKPLLMDHFLEGALECDVDLVRARDWTLVGGIVEHIEAAGVHSGDSMGVLPPQRLKSDVVKRIESLSKELAEALEVIGHLNLQLAVKDDEVYMIEANPRSSRSVPFVAKATSIPMVDLAIEAMLGGVSAPDLKKLDWHSTNRVSVKGVAFPFKKFKNSDAILGPEMKSTGESMGRGLNYSEALMKAHLSVLGGLPQSGVAFLSMRDQDKRHLIPIAKGLVDLGFELMATRGTAVYLIQNGLDCKSVRKVHEGRPNCIDEIRSGKVDLVINTTSGKTSIAASFDIRRSCVDFHIPCLTESDAAIAFLLALSKYQEGEFRVEPLPVYS